jgi:DNA (cytosine-5)-methyltransferase 1
MSKLRVLDLFSGIGGFSLGLERAGGFETVAFCEIDERCRAILARHWPGVRQYDDVRTADFPAADIVCGGFPCQDISQAGKRAGVSGARSGLFRELVRAIRLVRPKYAILENVADLLHRGMGDVCGELAASGLRVEWDCISAQDVGAPHVRDRIWIVAYADLREQSNGAVSSVRRGIKGKGKGKGRDANANGERQQQPGWCFREVWRRPFHGGSNFMGWREDWRDRLGALCRMDDGVSRRLDEAKPCGNSLLPDIPELIGRAIMQAEGKIA